MRPNGQAGGQVRVKARLGQKEGARRPCLCLWGTQKADGPCLSQWSPESSLYPSLPSPADAAAQVSSAALLFQEALLGAQVVATFGELDSNLGKAREAQQWMEQLLRGVGPPGTGTAVWELKLKELVNRVQMLHPQLLRLLVKAGVVGGDMDHYRGFAKARTLF